MQYWANMPKIVIILGLMIIFTMGIFLWNLKQSGVAMLLLIFLFLGAFNYKIHSEYEGRLKPFFDKDVVIIGNVLEASFKEQMQLTIYVEEVIFEGKVYGVEEKIEASFNGEYDENNWMIGKRIRTYGTVKEPKQRRNRRMFDQKLYLKGKDIYSLLYSTTDKIEVIGDGKGSALLMSAKKVNKRVQETTLNILPEMEGRILVGILLGDKDQLDEEIYNIFRGVGIAHILAVSGLHVGILYMVLKKILGPVPMKIRIIIILAVLYFYVMITGYAPSVLRAVSMAMILILGPVMDRKYDPLSALSAVCLVFIIVNPMILLQVSFQLSFIAVLSIIFFYGPIQNRLNFMSTSLAQALAVSTAAQIGIIPIIAYHFNNLSLGALLINVPVVMLLGILVPLALMIVTMGIFNLHLGAAFGWVLLLLIKAIILVATYTENISFLSINVVSPGISFMLFYYLFFMALGIDRKLFKMEGFNPNQGGALVLGIYILFIGIAYLIPNKMEITFVDVGQGDCTLIRTPQGKNILIDGGGNYQNSARKMDVGEDIVVPFLLKNGVGKIHMMMLSHPHQDHIGGLISVLNHLKVNEVFIGTDSYKTDDSIMMGSICQDKSIPIYPLEKGDRIRLEKNIVMDILHPPKELLSFTRDDVNNNSLVVLMEYHQKRFLFTGDIEMDGENNIIENFKHLRCDVLKVAHHGSRYSSTKKFIQQLKPEIAVIQVGKNSFGHPHPEVLEGLGSENIVVYRNDRNGSVILTLKGEDIEVETLIQ